MSRTIDERVVEMRFDNKQFEANAKESIGTLTKLREALNLSTKNSAKSLEGLDKAAKSVSLEGIAAGVEALQKRFSTLGIVGMRVIENITDSMMNTLGRGINFVSDSIVSGGIRRAMNLENAHFQLQALLKDETKVQEVMANANTAVDGTAYALDEAAKAASQFAASGIQAGDEMTNALRGVVGVSAMTNSEFSSVAQIFATVAGNGRLMGDQLLQLGARGLNAAATIADFVNGVRDGSKSASDEVTALVKNFNDGAKVTEQDIRELVSDGQISFKLFSEAMTEAFADSAERANETFTGALANMKSALARIGAGFISPLIAQNSEVVLLFNAIRERINDVKKALVFDEEIGNVHALSKQFTDTVLVMAKYTSEFIRNVDLSKPMEIFYNWVEVIKNLGKGLWTFLKPLGEAFRDVFLAFSMDDVVNLSAKIEHLTSNMRFTDRASKELRDAFKGLFSVVKLVIDVIVDIVRIFVPFTSVANDATAGVIGLAGAMGRGLTAFTEWFRNSKMIGAIYDSVSNAVKVATSSVGDFINSIVRFGKEVYEMKEVQELLENISKGFNNLRKMAWDAIVRINDKLVEFKFKIFDLIPAISGGNGLKNVIAELARWINNAIRTINNLDFTVVKNSFKSFTNVVKSLIEVLKGNQGLETFITNLKQFMSDISDAFTVDRVLEKVQTFRNKIDQFITWVKDKLGVLKNIFSELSVGGVISTTGGVGLIYAIIKMAQSFEKVASTIERIPNILTSLNSAIDAYQNNLKADSIKKVAGAILLLSGALVLLSFADTERMLKAAVALSTVAGVLLLGVSKLIEVNKKVKPVAQKNPLEPFLTSVGNGISTFLSKLGDAAKWKAIGSAFKNFGVALLAIIGSFAAVAYLYRKDPEALYIAMNIVKDIAAVMITVMAVMSLLGKILDSGMKSFAAAAGGVLLLTASMMLTIMALKKLFNMEIPDDYKKRLGILEELFATLALTALAVGIASRIAGDGKIKAGPILALTVMLYATVSALQKLFAMELPYDYGKKLAILAGIFVALGGLVKAIGKASKSSEGGLKAAGTILAMCVMMATIVGSLMILSLFPGEKLIKGAASLGIVLVGLATTLYGAGKIVKGESYKAVLAMAIAVGSITVALGVLSMIPSEKLLKAGAALGLILLGLAADLYATGKITNEQAYLSILAMVAAVMSIGISLALLSQQPWEQMIAASAAMSIVLLAFAELLKTISSRTGLKEEKINEFLKCTLVILPIGVALYALSSRPWSQMLASAASMSLVFMAFGELLKTISSRTGLKEEKINEFLKSTLAIIPIGVALYLLATQPWDQMLAAGAALSGTIIAYSAAFLLISNAKPDDGAITAFLAGTVGIAMIALSLRVLATQPWEQLLAAGTSVSMVLLAMSVALGILSKVGVSVGPATQAAFALDAFIVILAAAMVGLGVVFQKIQSLEGFLDKGIEILVKIGEGLGRFAGAIISGVLQEISNSLPVIGDNLSAFMTNAKPFLDGMSQVNEQTLQGVKYLAETILLLTAGSIVNGLASLIPIGGGLVSFGEQLAEFAPYIKKYAKAVEGIKPEVVIASANAAQSLAQLATNLPNSGGLAAKIFGDNSLSEFAEELADFGPVFSAYSNSVSNVDPEVVEASAKAAESLAAMASKLPNSGGFAAKVFGDNTLSEFARELKKFGPEFAAYAETVSNVNPEVVIASANAAQCLADLANKLPNSGGFASKVFGDNTLSDFGHELKRFGKYFAEYAESISGVSPSVVISSANAAQTLADLANTLPNSGGFISLFTGNNDISAFGEGLVTFGEGLAAYYDSVSGINVSTLNGVVAAIKNLINLAQMMSATDTSGMVGFPMALASMADTGITQFIEAFNAADSKVAAAVKSMMDAATTAIQNGNPQFQTYGVKSAESWIQGIQSKYPSATSVTKVLVTNVINVLQQQIPYFQQKGTISATQYLTGIRNQYGTATSTGTTLANNVLSGIKSVDFTQAGKNAGQGFANGLKSTTDLASQAGKALGEAALKSAKSALEVKSPSRKMYEVGEFAGLGFVNALMYMVSKAANAGEELGDATLQGASDAISSISRIITDDMVEDPVIRPIVDLSNVEQSVSQISDLFNKAIRITAINADSVAGTISARGRNISGGEIQNQQGAGTINNFNFEQINNSPKALTRSEIYRQTKNLFSTWKGAVEA